MEERKGMLQHPLNDSLMLVHSFIRKFLSFVSLLRLLGKESGEENDFNYDHHGCCCNASLSLLYEFMLCYMSCVTTPNETFLLLYR